MSKIKLITEAFLSPTNQSSEYPDVQELILPNTKPNYSVIDITVIPDELYQPTIQSILISLDEEACLKESQSKKLDINILSETVNNKTGYSNSLFEFESSDSTITLSLVLQETETKGIYKVEAYTTRGVKVFETNTLRPKEIINKYLNSLANEYLISKPLNEADDPIKDDVKEDLAIEPGSDEETQLEEIYEEPEDEDQTEAEILGKKLANEIITNKLKIDYSNWNYLDDKEKEELVKPKLEKFFDQHIQDFKKDIHTFIFLLGSLEDASLYTEAKVIDNLYDKIRKGGE